MISKPTETIREIRKNTYREAILAAAEKVFADHGFDAARIQQVAEVAEVSVGTIYGVFGSKAELFGAVLTYRLPELLEATHRAAMDAPDPLASLIRGMDVYLGFMLSHPDWLRIHLHEHAWGLGPTRAAAEQLTAWREGLDLQAQVLEQAMDAGQVVRGDPTLMARAMAAIQQVHLADWIEHGMSEPADTVRERLRGLFLMFFSVERRLP